MSEAEAVKERFRQFVQMLIANPGASRARWGELAKGFELPGDVTIESADADGVPGEWLRIPESRESAALLYLHGGGYTTGNAAAFRHLTADLARATRTTALSIDYALAPERPYPHGLNDALRSYIFLLDRGIDPGSIILAGDSAGGGLTTTLMLKIRQEGLPQPAAAWLISPFVDLERSGESYSSQADVDPIAFGHVLMPPRHSYCGEASPRDPMVSPIYADLRGLPPMRIDAGSHETMLDDSLRLARRAAISDVDVELRVWPNMVHIFPFFAPMLRQGREAIAAAAQFFNRHLPE